VSVGASIENMWPLFERKFTDGWSEADKLRARLGFLAGATGLMLQYHEWAADPLTVIELREEARRLQWELVGIAAGLIKAKGEEGG
jgi:hypothetical protein